MRPFFVNPSVRVLGLAVTMAFVLSSAALGGVLDGHPNAATSGSVNLSGATIDIDVDYAVFAPGDYPNAYPDAATEYVYAYQAFVGAASNNMLFLSIGGNPGFEFSAADNPGVDVALGAGDIPFNQLLDLAGSKTFRNVFNPSVASGSNTAVLLFTSPNPWEDAGAAATVSGGASANGVILPGPVPEPFSLAFMLAGGAALVRSRRLR